MSQPAGKEDIPSPLQLHTAVGISKVRQASSKTPPPPHPSFPEARQTDEVLSTAIGYSMCQ